MNKRGLYDPQGQALGYIEGCDQEEGVIKSPWCRSRPRARTLPLLVGNGLGFRD